MSSPKSIFTSSDSHLGRLANVPSLPTPTDIPTNQSSTPPTHPRSLSRSNIPPSPKPVQNALPLPPVTPSSSQQGVVAPKPIKPLPPLFQTPALAGQKRPAQQESQSEPLHKRRRVPSFNRHTLDEFDFPETLPALRLNDSEQPPSPLFFSHNRQRPRLPPRFSSSEAGARMLSKAHAEESTIKTVTLARGSFAGSSPPVYPILSTRPSGSTSAAHPRPSSPEVSKHRGQIVSIRSALCDGPRIVSWTSSDNQQSSEQPRLLAQIGIVELLEQDSRPTFIVDIGDGSNYASPTLRIVFANSALRANSHLLDLVQGRISNSSPHADGQRFPKGFASFKAWLFSATANGESLDVCLPAFIHGGLSWTCSTLRKRLRVVSAAPAAMGRPASTSGSSVSTISIITENNTILATPLRSSARLRSGTPSRHSVEEPTDYFGDAALHTPQIDDSAKVITSTHSIEPPKQLISPPRILRNSTRLQKEDIIRGLKESSLQDNGDTKMMELAQITPEQAESGFFDWTRLPLSDTLPRHIQFARSVDWGATALGPIEYWTSDLRQMCNLIMASPHPAAMYWGPDLVAIYNEAYVLLAGQKHPNLMGQSYKDAWAEIWDEVKDVFASARLTGQATMKDDDCLFIKRSHCLEETYFSWSIIPMVGSDGAVTGLYNPAFEKTRRKVAERRMLTLREIGERTASARDVRSFWTEVAAALELNEYDTPFVLLYSVNDESDSDSSSIHSSSLYGSRTVALEGSLGVPPDHKAAPQIADLKGSMEGFVPFFRECMKTEKPSLLHVVDDLQDFESPGSGHPLTPPVDNNPRLHASMLEGIDFRGFRDACTSVVVCPIHPTTGESTLGFLVLGVNPRRPYDDDYHLFVQLLSRQLATSLASVVLFEEEIRRGQRAAKLAALDRIELSEQLAVRTQEAKDIETRFTRMAELSPTGLFIADSHGHITYCNETWFEITRVPKDAISIDRWMNALLAEDRARMQELWNKCTTQCVPVSDEFRFKARWEDRNGNMSDTWVLFAAYPEKYLPTSPTSPDGLKAVFGSITDISQQKWIEGLQKRKMEEAIELKRQQENFIDITSHGKHTQDNCR